MDQVYYAITETLIPWVEDRFGIAAAWLVAMSLTILPLIGVVCIVSWLLAADAE